MQMYVILKDTLASYGGSESCKTLDQNRRESLNSATKLVVDVKLLTLFPEKFQILRDLIPHTDQKRDTASFLLEVIQYVQYLQEKVQKYEGSYQPWSSEPTKLMPWKDLFFLNLGFAFWVELVAPGLPSAGYLSYVVCELLHRSQGFTLCTPKG
ncbi:hypothetical protein H5410_019363 [Solanum commersonii]|uniref:BHLH domain-containing protein n=1 Tax=Solanum commersonii TaxID=4109 RepID=A0A9J5Z613_SOLCO|nr:hypothetical protein H5410_019363 [Solanum commersonii]